MKHKTKTAAYLLTKTFLLTFFLFCSYTAFAQQNKIDSLRQALKTETVKIKRLKLLYLLCNATVTTDLSNEHRKEIEEQIKLAKELKEYYYLISAYINYSTYCGFRKERDLAIKQIRSAKHLADSIKDYIYLQGCMGQEALFLEEKKEYKKAEEILFQSLQVVEKNNLPDDLKGSTHAKIAAFYYRNKSEDKAIKHYLQALKLYEKAPPKSASMQDYFACFQGLARIYIIREQYDKAEKYIKNAIRQLQNIEYVHKWGITVLYRRILGIIYMHKKQERKAIKEFLFLLNSGRDMDLFLEYDINNKIAGCYCKIKEYNQALPYSNKAISVALRLQQEQHIIPAYIVKAEVLNGLKKYYQANNTLKKVEKDIAKQSVGTRISFYIKKTEILKNIGNYKQALVSSTKLHKLKDARHKDLMNSKVAALETKYQTEKKEKENLQLKEEKAQQALLLQKENQQKWLLLLILLAVLVILGVFIFYYKRNKQQKELIERLQRELHHRIKNNLAIIDSLVEDIKLDMAQGNVEQRLTDLQNRIVSINEIHAQLYRNRDITNLNLQKYVAVLVKNIENSFAKPNVEVEQNIPSALQMKTEKLFPVGLIINEFVTNSYKYAFTPKQKGNIKINISETAKTYQLQLTDNGKGLPNDFNIDNLTSFGMEVIQLLSKQLQGSFVLSGTNGVTININFPK